MRWFGPKNVNDKVDRHDGSLKPLEYEGFVVKEVSRTGLMLVFSTDQGHEVMGRRVGRLFLSGVRSNV